jgi:hypothetical protein
VYTEETAHNIALVFFFFFLMADKTNTFFFFFSSQWLTKLMSFAKCVLIL